METYKKWKKQDTQGDTKIGQANRRPIERPRKRWMDGVKEDVKKRREMVKNINKEDNMKVGSYGESLT